MKPGRRNVAGEMLFEALMPLHRAASDSRAAQTTNHRIFQFNLTEWPV
jgi:hypothetical protein